MRGEVQACLKSLDNHPGSQTMCREFLNKRFHTFPSLGNVFIIQLLKIHNVTSQLDNFSRWVILPNKNIFALIPRIYVIPRQRLEPNFRSFPQGESKKS